jgi:hypothetical protein
MRVRDIVQRLLPQGTEAVEGSTPRWEACPPWPPDVFAVAATLISISGYYADSRYAAGLTQDGLFDDDYRARVKKLGKEWRETGLPPEMRVFWSRLLEDDAIIEQGGTWHDAAMMLLAIADEASVSFGFPSEDPRLPLARFVFKCLEEYKVGEATGVPIDVSVPKPLVPHSLCIAVPRSAVCVQPKTRTPQVGCTLRSLSHNLALLPPAGDVTTRWDFAGLSSAGSDRPLNLVLVPFPYFIGGRCFEGETTKVGSRSIGFFRMNQEWLEGCDVRSMADFLMALIAEGQKEVREVHGVVFPEGAMTRKMADALGDILAAETDLELFISGVTAVVENSSCNRTWFETFQNHVPHFRFEQAKHHRWKLDRQQIRRYQLAHILDETITWWEKIDVSRRECNFYVFRHGASLAVLVCEDLARIDPVQTVLRSVGPNLVIALLMDGPQLERRWPGRYATVLADDPGSAVLTLTSLGLIRRSTTPRSRNIALWKEAQGTAQELELPDGAHALVLSLAMGMEENFASDWRSDDGMSMTMTLNGTVGIRVDASKFSWLKAS